MQRQIQESHTCAICLSIYYKPVSIRKCRHIFCQPCIDEATQYTDIKKCPLCRTIFNSTDIIPQPNLQKQITEHYPDEVKERAKSFRDRIVYKIRVGNTTNVNDKISINKYEWSFYVEPAEGEAPLNQYADRVEVYLHPTFHPNTIIFPANQKIEIRKRGWGTFRIDVKIVWKKKFGGYTDVYHDLSFQPKKQSVLCCKIYKSVEL